MALKDFGPSDTDRNLAPWVLYITFWVGLVFVSVLFGNVFAAFSPWRALGRATGWLVKPFNPEQLIATLQKVLG